MGNTCWRITNAQFTHKEGVVLPQLPKELITEVLKRLPVKSLLRFRCVSKSFREIINSQYFINLHLRGSGDDWSHLYLMFPNPNEISTNYNSVKLHASDFDIRLINRLEVYGHCNGVFLLLVDDSRPALWNPSTHQYRILPCLPGQSDDRCRCDYIRMGLGYDPSEDDYKVVVIDTFNFKNQSVWIFGLRSNSWRRVCTDFVAPKRGLYKVGCFADGVLYWLCGNLTANIGHIVAFDLAKDKFSLSTPPAYYQAKKTITCLNVLDGCLCIGFCDYVIEDEALLYVRKKDGAESIWSLLYSVTIDQLPTFLKVSDFVDVRVLEYSVEGDKIILDLGLYVIVSYDLKEKCFQPTNITRPRDKLFFKARSVVESLVPIR